MAAQAAFTVTIRGLQGFPEMNVRSAPGTNQTLAFKAAVGLSGLPVLEVQPDVEGRNLNGKIYQWFRVAFPDGREGWTRDDLVDIVGDGSAFGYGVYTQPVLGFSVTRDTSVGTLAPGEHITPAENAPAATTPSPVTPAPAPERPIAVVSPPVMERTSGPDRVRRAAFNITAAFEGGGYATYQTYDSGIISYGRFQFTLAAGSLLTVINRYLQRSSAAITGEIRNYMPRLQAKDENLRGDARLKELLKQAAQETVMQTIQDEVATEGYYEPVFELSIHPRGIVLPLSQALVFDMAINHGRFNHLLPKAEESFGVPSKSRLVENGVSERQFIQRLAELRRDNLYALANKHNLPGLKKRGDFWVQIVSAGDWHLQGDGDGNVNINGKIVQVRNPQ